MTKIFKLEVTEDENGLARVEIEIEGYTSAEQFGCLELAKGNLWAKLHQELPEEDKMKGDS